MNAIYWLILFIVLLVIEIITLGLTTIWFAGGALTAFVLSMLEVPHAHGRCVILTARRRKRPMWTV